MRLSASTRQGATLVIVAVVTLTSLTGIAVAQPAATGMTVVEEGETTGGISTVAGTVVVRGTVDGSVNVVAGDVVIGPNGTVTGDVNGASGSLRVAGTVGGTVDFAGGSVIIARTATIAGDVNLGAGTVTIAGAIDGNARVGAETITVAPTAVIAGDLRYDGDLTLAPGATVGGDVRRDASIGGSLGPSGIGARLGIPGWLDTVYAFFANLLLGALLLVLLPGYSHRVADRVEDHPVRTGGWGVVALLAIPLVLLAFAITVVGIPIALLGVLLYLLALWLGAVYGSFAVGRAFLGAAGRESWWGALLGGLILFSLLGVLPFVGALFRFVILLLGLGGVASTAPAVVRRNDMRSEEPTV
ncbi:MAG: polymer-forming cytoskeletal protein [Halanaeroarchaeum sp.]